MQHEPRVRGVLVLGTVELVLTTVHPDPVREVCQVARARVPPPHRVAKQHERLVLQVIRSVLDEQPCRLGAVLPGQPCTVMICRIRAELAWSIAIMTEICSRVGLAGISVRTFWSAATRASSSARSAAAALGVRLMCQVYTDLVQCPNGLPVRRRHLRLHSGGARRAVEARAPQEGLAARIRSTR